VAAGAGARARPLPPLPAALNEALHASGAMVSSPGRAEESTGVAVGRGQKLLHARRPRAGACQAHCGARLPTKRLVRLRGWSPPGRRRGTHPQPGGGRQGSGGGRGLWLTGGLLTERSREAPGMARPARSSEQTSCLWFGTPRVVPKPQRPC
ncbi:unnamed protein product, partial [Prorocentrum cordatum]